MIFCRHRQTDADCHQRIPKVNRSLLILLPQNQTAEQQNDICHRIEQRVRSGIKEIGIAVKGKNRQQKAEISPFSVSRHNFNAEIDADIRQKRGTADHIPQQNHRIRSTKNLSQKPCACRGIVKRQVGIPKKIKHINIPCIEMLIQQLIDAVQRQLFIHIRIKRQLEPPVPAKQEHPRKQCERNRNRHRQFFLPLFFRSKPFSFVQSSYIQSFM